MPNSSVHYFHVVDQHALKHHHKIKIHVEWSKSITRVEHDSDKKTLIFFENDEPVLFYSEPVIRHPTSKKTEVAHFKWREHKKKITLKLHGEPEYPVDIAATVDTNKDIAREACITLCSFI